MGRWCKLRAQLLAWRIDGRAPDHGFDARSGAMHAVDCWPVHLQIARPHRYIFSSSVCLELNGVSKKSTVECAHSDCFNARCKPDVCRLPQWRGVQCCQTGWRARQDGSRRVNATFAVRVARESRQRVRAQRQTRPYAWPSPCFGHENAEILACGHCTSRFVALQARPQQQPRRSQTEAAHMPMCFTLMEMIGSFRPMLGIF